MTVRAVQMAKHILRRGQFAAPIDVEAVARSLNIQVVEQDLEDDVSGVLVVKDETAIIGVNQAHHINRKRFTIAHELGHYMLHRNASKVFIDSMPVFFRDSTSGQGVERQEVEANAFAAELLMPEQMIYQELKGRKIDVYDEQSINGIAEQFGVSTQALTIRLTKLGLI